MANRSTGWVETGRLHPAVNAKISKIHNLLLWMVGLDGFKVALLTSQDFCAETLAIGAEDSFLGRLISLEASHALHFGRYKTNVQLGLFRAGAFAERTPLGLNRVWVKIAEFTKGQMNMSNPRLSIFLNAEKYVIKDESEDLQFAHVPRCDDNE